MNIIINESQYNFLRRLPAVEQELNKHLKRVDPTKFETFRKYIDYLSNVTMLYLSDEIISGEFMIEFEDYIKSDLRINIKKIYNSGKPGGLF